MQELKEDIRYFVTKADKENKLAVGDRVFFYPSGLMEVGPEKATGKVIFSVEAKEIMKTAEVEIDGEWARENILSCIRKARDINGALEDEAKQRGIALRYSLYWRDGTHEVVSGESLEKAMSAAGYEGVIMRALDFYMPVPEQLYSWNGATRRWE